MTCTIDEMTLAEILQDPMIRSVMRADGVSLDDFGDLMRSTAKSLKTGDDSVLGRKLSQSDNEARSKRALVVTRQMWFANSSQPCSANM